MSSRRRRPKAANDNGRPRKSEGPNSSASSSAQKLGVPKTSPAYIVPTASKSPSSLPVVQPLSAANTPSPIAAHATGEAPPIHAKPAALSRTSSCPGSGVTSASVPKATSASLARVRQTDEQEVKSQKPKSTARRKSVSPKAKEPIVNYVPAQPQEKEHLEFPERNVESKTENGVPKSPMERTRITPRKSPRASAGRKSPRSFTERKSPRSLTDRKSPRAFTDRKSPGSSKERKSPRAFSHMKAEDKTGNVRAKSPRKSPRSLADRKAEPNLENLGAKSPNQLTAKSPRKSPRRPVSMSTKSPVRKRSSVLAAAAVVDADAASENAAPVNEVPFVDAAAANAPDAPLQLPVKPARVPTVESDVPPKHASENLQNAEPPQNASNDASPASIEPSAPSKAPPMHAKPASRRSAKLPEKLSKRRKPAKYAAATMPAVPRLQMKKLKAEAEKAKEHTEEKSDELTPRTSAAVRESLFDRLSKPKLQRIVSTRSKKRPAKPVRSQTLTRPMTSRTASRTAARARHHSQNDTGGAPPAAAASARLAVRSAAAPRKSSAASSRANVSGLSAPRSTAHRKSSAASASSSRSLPRPLGGSASARSSGRSRLAASSSTRSLLGRKVRTGF